MVGSVLVLERGLRRRVLSIPKFDRLIHGGREEGSLVYVVPLARLALRRVPFENTNWGRLSHLEELKAPIAPCTEELARS